MVITILCFYVFTAIPKVKRLTEFEKGEIGAFSSSEFKSRAIVQKIGRPKTVLHNFVN